MQQRIYDWLHSEQFFIAGRDLLLDMRVEMPRRWRDYHEDSIVLRDDEDALLAKITALRDYDFTPSEKVAQKPVKAAVSNEPEEVRTLRLQGAKAYDEYERLKTALREAVNKEERKAIAIQIMQLVRTRIDVIYSRIRHFEQTGEIPFVLNDAAQQAVAMMKRIKTLEPQISRLKKQASEAARTELIEKSAELERLKIQLGL